MDDRPTSGPATVTLTVHFVLSHRGETVATWTAPLQDDDPTGLDNAQGRVHDYIAQRDIDAEDLTLSATVGAVDVTLNDTSADD